MEKTRSITEAAENLYMSQPNLSRAIRELEGVLGISIFDRTPKGILPTAQGEEFLHYARSILSQFDEMTERYTRREGASRVLRLSVPRSSYIAQAFTRFARLADPGLTLDYKETNALRSIRNVTEDGYDLGIVRFQADYEKYFVDTFREKGLQYRELWSFRYLALMRCCVYKERAILAERVKLAMGGDQQNPNVVEVIGIACDECPISGYQVGRDCRGCIAHRCMGKASTLSG